MVAVKVVKINRDEKVKVLGDGTKKVKVDRRGDQESESEWREQQESESDRENLSWT